MFQWPVRFILPIHCHRARYVFLLYLQINVNHFPPNDDDLLHPTVHLQQARTPALSQCCLWLETALLLFPLHLLLPQWRGHPLGCLPCLPLRCQHASSTSGVLSSHTISNPNYLRSGHCNSCPPNNSPDSPFQFCHLQNHRSGLQLLLKRRLLTQKKSKSLGWQARRPSLHSSACHHTHCDTLCSSHSTECLESAAARTQTSITGGGPTS